VRFSWKGAYLYHRNPEMNPIFMNESVRFGLSLRNSASSASSEKLKQLAERNSKSLRSRRLSRTQRLELHFASFISLSASSSDKQGCYAVDIPGFKHSSRMLPRFRGKSWGSVCQLTFDLCRQFELFLFTQNNPCPTIDFVLLQRVVPDEALFNFKHGTLNLF